MYDSEEYKKCLEFPAYFYNNYVVIIDKTTGEHHKPNPITDEQIENAVNYSKFKNRVRSNPYEITADTLQWIKDKYSEEIIMITSQNNDTLCQQD